MTQFLFATASQKKKNTQIKCTETSLRKGNKWLENRRNRGGIQLHRLYNQDWHGLICFIHKIRVGDNAPF